MKAVSIESSRRPVGSLPRTKRSTMTSTTCVSSPARWRKPVGCQVDEPALNPGPGQTVFEQRPGQCGTVRARQDLERKADLVAGPFGKLVDRRGDASGRGGNHGLAAVIADHLADPRKKQAEIFMNLGDRPDRTPRRRQRLAPATAIAGGMLSIRSASGFSSGSRNCRA